jgi:peptide/nickel transport system permease protein
MLLKLLLRRVMVTVPTLLGLTLVVFFMIKAVPGDSALLLLGERASAESLEEFRRVLGLDQPWHVQYGRFMSRVLVEGDLGRSVVTQQPVTQILMEKFPATVELASAAMIFAMLVGIPMGLLAAMKPGSIIDVGSMSSAVFGVSMPIFWLALMLIWIFGLTLEWLPISGRIGIEQTWDPVTGFVFLDALIAGNPELLLSACAHIILPAVALGTIPMAFLARITRSSMIEVLSQDYVRTARAKGVGQFLIVTRHALKNAAIPVLTVLGLQFGLLLGGAIITETVFAWPGIGSFLLEAVGSRDYPSLQGGILVTATAFVAVNLVVDIAYRAFDPRMRTN